MADLELIPPEYKTAEGLRTLANFLRSQNGVKVRSGIEHEKRVDYFKGKRLIECVLEPKKWPKSIPAITDKGVAVIVANLLIQNSFFHRSEKVDGKKGILKISQKNVFEDAGYYTWMYAGNMVWSNVATGAVIAVVIGFTLLPIWPEAAKKVLWYCSVTFLIATLVFVFVRFIAFLVMWLLGYEFWVFPRLFDESLSFQDSFKPVYSFEKGSPGQGYYRIGVVVLIFAFIYWASTQPTEFDGFLKAQKDFIDDLYSGNLLADVSQEHKDNLDRSKRVPSIEDILKQMQEEERLDSAPHEYTPEELKEADDRKSRVYNDDGELDETELDSFNNGSGSGSEGNGQEQGVEKRDSDEIDEELLKEILEAQSLE